MSVSNQRILLNQAITADGTTVGDAMLLPPFASSYILTCEVSGRTDGTYTLTVQHSPDGDNWFTLDAVAAISSNTMSIKVVTGQSFHHIRASLVAGSVTTGATAVDCRIWFENKK